MREEAVQVDRQQAAGKWKASAEEEVASDDGPEDMLRAGQDFGDDAGSGGCDDGGDDGEEPGGGDAGEVACFMNVHPDGTLAVPMPAEVCIERRGLA